MRACVFACLLTTAAGACDRRGAPSAAMPMPATRPVVVVATRPGQAQSDEEQVLELALVTFAHFGDEIFLKPTARKHRLVVHHQTVDKSGMLSDGQLAADVDGTGWSIPPDVRRDLRARNAGSVALTAYRFTDPRLLVADVDGAMGNDFVTRDEKFEVAFPEGYAHAHVWLPGFSPDGREAVVRFWFGPTPHGATGTFFLAKGSDGWRVKWHKISHYL